MNYKSLFLLVFAISLPLQSCTTSGWSFKKRTYLHVVGSSTVSPFMAAISEEFSRGQSLKNNIIETPVVESTGTREGFKLFCAGVGYKYPDFADASRLMEMSEIANCNKNGVKEIVAVKIGYDGIVFGNSIGSKKIKLTKEQIFLALAEKVNDKKTGKIIANPYTKWSQIDPSLPKDDILIYGPPLTSGTRDIFAELLMDDVCFTKKEFVASYKSEALRKKQCERIRSDGRFVESGENDNLIIQNMKNNPKAFGIFGFNFLVANRNVVQVVTIDNIEPNFETISSKKYRLSRPLFVYFKKEHLDLMPEMRDFIRAIVGADTIGRKGYLLHNGLIALSDEELNEIRKDTLSQL